MKRFVSLIVAVSIISTFCLQFSSVANKETAVSALITVAESQVGYTEESGEYTKYGSWYGANPAPWCAIFISWCANQAGISKSVIPKHASCDDGMNFFKKQGTWGWGNYWGSRMGYSVYTPVPGDIVYFGNGDLNDSNHAGIVYKADSANVYTIEGNTSNKCAYKQYSLNDDYIYGYGHPNYSECSDIKPIQSIVATPVPTAKPTPKPTLKPTPELTPVPTPTPVTGPSEITLTAGTYPVSISSGSSIQTTGKISSKYNLTWVRVSVYDANGNIVLSSKNTNSSKVFDIAKMNSPLEFSSLTAGKYSYRVEVKDSNDTYQILLNKIFYVAGRFSVVKSEEVSYRISSSDYIRIKKYFSNSDCLPATDINGNNHVTSSDFLLVKKFLENKQPV